jgi:sigma-B regulation protein RsbU (phosphoserine phosphatase)
MPAALLMAMNLKVIRSEASRPSLPPPNTIITRSSNLLYRDFNQAVMFSTIFIGQYDRSNREFTYANAGHSPVVYCPKGGEAVILEADSVPIGLFLDIKLEAHKIKINPGDVLVMATDGINETSNLSNRLFGITQLKSLIEKLSTYSATEIKEGIMEAVHIYGAGKAQEDDRTLIVIKGE